MAAAPSSSSSQLALHNDQMYTTDEQVLEWPECCVGAFMRAISHAGIRYEGVCFYLNLQQKILGLTDVTIFVSTEGRTEDNTEIPPLETEYDTVLLLGSHIKDLQILFLQDLRNILPDGQIIIQIDYIPRPTPTNWQVTDVMKDILSRLVALLQGISDNKSESLWSSEFWTPLPSSSSSSSPAPTLKDLDALGPRSFLPGQIESDPGVIGRPRAKQGSAAAAAEKKQKSILGPCPKLYMTAIQSIETAASSERKRSREQQQQPTMPSSEKDDTLESPSVDSGAGRGELVASEENRTTSDEVGAPRGGRTSGQGSREPRQGGRGVVSSPYRGRYHNNANAAARGGKKVYWAPIK